MLTLQSAEQMVACGRDVASLAQAGDVLILDGPLGAGKTTFTRGLGEGLNVRGPISSPTFVIARVHPSLGTGPPLVHVDAYRVASLPDLDSLDPDASPVGPVTGVVRGLGRVEQLADSYLVLSLGRCATSGSEIDGSTPEDDVRTVEWNAVGQAWESRIPRLNQILGPARN